MADPFKGNASIAGPGATVIDVSAGKSDSADLSSPVRAIRANGAGDVVFLDYAGGGPWTVTLAAGEVFDLCYVSRVKSTGTTATGLLGVV